tara:strand:- start:1300 stop:1824 length:525 start_codon:yes stop_codon:yes gene_type:complete
MPKKSKTTKKNSKKTVDLMKNLDPEFLKYEHRFLANAFGMTIAYLIDFYIIYITISYLNDLRSNVDCNKLNSSVLNFYYDYYLMLLILPIIISILYPILLYNLLFNRISTASFVILLSIVCFGINFYFIKLLYDLGQEEECKDIDPNYRQFLFYLNVFGFIMYICNIISAVMTS